jgi:valyl-tRNA synthetase
MSASSEAYRFWLYELCDVYIEAMKPLMDPSSSAEARNSAQNTLYTCLDHGLRLLNPFMSFVTEELWQRLPRRPNDPTPSVMVASFPVFDLQQQDQEAEKQFDTLFAIVKAIRSLAGQYALQTNLQSFIQTTSAATQLEAGKHNILSLAKGSTSVQVVQDIKNVPSGCVSEIVSKDIVVHLLVKGLINTEAEIQKSQKKEALAQSSLAKLQQAMESPDYEKKIPANVRERNTDKVRVEATLLRSAHPGTGGRTPS